MPAALSDVIGGPAGYVLVLARSTGLVWSLAWLAGAAGVGLRSRLATAVVIAAAVSPIVDVGAASPIDPQAMGLRLAIEVASGAVLGLGAGLIAAAARLAGELIGAQTGLSAASTLAPGDDGPATPLSTLGGLLALATFASLDGPMRLALALARSYRLGAAVEFDGQAVQATFSMVGEAIRLALWLAAPVVLALLVAQVAVGLLARSAPALTSFTAWLPARLSIGLILTLIGVAGLVSALASAWTATLPAG